MGLLYERIVSMNKGKIMKSITMIATLMLLVGCAEAHDGLNGVQGPAGPPGVAPITPIPSSVDVVVSEYNEQRQALGQELISQGLQCTLYTVPNTTTAIIGAVLTNVGSWEYSGTFNQPNGSSAPGINILPVQLQPLYSSYYIVKCTGLLIVPSSGFYGFTLASDDGANLYVNGLLINNDGIHSVATKVGAKYLARGVASFELDYYDTGGNHALVLNQNGNILPALNLYH